MTTYRLTPTEPDGDVTGYVFTDEPALWDYVTDTLAGEYNMDATDIVGTVVYGYHNAIGGGLRRCHYANGGPMCEGHMIASVVRQ